MRKTSSIITIIFIIMSLNVFIFRAYGKCIEECTKKCEAIIDEKYAFGEGYMKDNKSAVDYLKMKNKEKVKCHEECKEECSQNIKKETVDTGSELKKEPKEELRKGPKEELKKGPKEE